MASTNGSSYGRGAMNSKPMSTTEQRLPGKGPGKRPAPQPMPWQTPPWSPLGGGPIIGTKPAPGGGNVGGFQPPATTQPPPIDFGQFLTNMYGPGGGKGGS